MAIFHQLPDSVLQLLAVFLSIIIEALPFVLLGSIVSGFIEVFLTPEKVQNFLPKNKVLAILFGTLFGFIFPSCECGIVPIITRFLEKIRASAEEALLLGGCIYFPKEIARVQLQKILRASFLREIAPNIFYYTTSCLKILASATRFSAQANLLSWYNRKVNLL